MRIAMKLVIALVVAGTTLFADNQQEMPPYQGGQVFESLKELAGIWKGVMEMEGTSMDYTVIYRVIAGGSALQETSFPGTPKEMVSIYHEEGGKVVMTHYCMLGNQPEMKLVDSTNNLFSFNFAGGANIAPSTSTYMSSVVFNLSGENEMTQTWGMIRDGNVESKNVLALKRSP